MTLSVAQALVREAPPFTQEVHGPITFVAHCERHGIPFFGQAYVGYLPISGRVGTTALRRMVHRAARYGENAFADELSSMLQVCVKPAGIALIVHTSHDCVGPRLLDEAGTRREATWRGRYRADAMLRAEFLRRCAQQAA